MENKKINDKRFYELSDLVLSKEQNMFSFTHIVDNEINNNAYPSNVFACNLMDAEGPPIDILEISRNLVTDIQSKFNLECTIFLYYPPNGLIDWHTNENFEYYNAICSFSEKGKRFFEYIDKGNDIVRVNDHIGWTVKKTKWSSKEPVFHRAVSRSDNRITVTFSSNLKNDIDNFINSITSTIHNGTLS